MLHQAVALAEDRLMDALRHAAVLDVSRTQARLALVDMVTFREIKTLAMPNVVLPGPPYAHFDTEATWQFVLAGLKEFQRFYDVEAISLTAHAAAAALVDAEGALALPVLDPDDPGPEETAALYNRIRPGFAETGSPRLPNGQNLGAQIFWQSQQFRADWRRVAHILTLPQYWAFRLSGVRASEATSLGCHTDLWAPQLRQFSSLVTGLGLAPRFPPVRPASTRLGALLPEVAAATGVGEGTGVWCGLEQTGAALMPHVLNRERPVTVISTGAFLNVIALGGAQTELQAGRETFWNVDALGDPLPSARFMGGHELAALTAGRKAGCSEAEYAQVVTLGIRVDRGPGEGLFRWSRNPAALSDGECFAAATIYLARECVQRLDWIGSRGPLIVEGPMTGNGLFLDALALLSGRVVRVPAGNASGTSVGAALLITRPPRTGQTLDHHPGLASASLAAALRANQGIRS